MTHNILKVHSVCDYSSFVGHEDKHPLISVINYAEVSPILHTKAEFFVYALFLLDDTLEALAYGQYEYGYEKGTLVCVPPGQIGGVDYDGQRFERRGWALLFHPDLLKNTPLEQSIKKYTFFEYQVNEALHMTENKRETYLLLLHQLRGTLEQTDNPHRDSIAVTYIELILKYCKRFYDRQFVTDKIPCNKLLKRFDKLLSSCLHGNKPASKGIPTVTWCAQELCLSPNYFGDLIKKGTGKTATEYIRQAIIKEIKNRLINGVSPNQIATEMGFERSQDLNRFFKRYTGKTLVEYAEQNKGVNK